VRSLPKTNGQQPASFSRGPAEVHLTDRECYRAKVEALVQIQVKPAAPSSAASVFAQGCERIPGRLTPLGLLRPPLSVDKSSERLAVGTSAAEFGCVYHRFGDAVGERFVGKVQLL
jgi:hypothetical protein